MASCISIGGGDVAFLSLMIEMFFGDGSSICKDCVKSDAPLETCNGSVALPMSCGARCKTWTYCFLFTTVCTLIGGYCGTESSVPPVRLSVLGLIWTRVSGFKGGGGEKYCLVLWKVCISLGGATLGDNYVVTVLKVDCPRTISFFWLRLGLCLCCGCGGCCCETTCLMYSFGVVTVSGVLLSTVLYFHYFYEAERRTGWIASPFLKSYFAISIALDPTMCFAEDINNLLKRKKIMACTCCFRSCPHSWRCRRNRR